MKTLLYYILDYMCRTLLSRNDNFRFIEGLRMIILPRKRMSSTIDVMMVFLNVSHV